MLKTADKGNNYIVEIPSYNKTGTNPISVSDFKQWAKIQTSDDDSLIGDLIEAITDEAEKILNLSIVTQTITVIMDVERAIVRLPYTPIKSISTIEYWDDGWQTLDTSKYDLISEMIQLKDAPVTYYRIEYEAGYSDVPKGIIHALKQAILTAYEDRQDHAEDGVNLIPQSSLKRLLQYKRY